MPDDEHDDEDDDDEDDPDHAAVVEEGQWNQIIRYPHFKVMQCNASILMSLKC